MKKTVILIGILMIVALFGCGEPDNGLEKITISAPGAFDQETCEERGFTDKVIMIESKYCTHCEETKPDFIEICEAKGITPEILDMAEAEHRDTLEKYGIEVQFTPTFIFGCEYHVGVKNKEEYLDLCEQFLAQND